MLAIASTFDPRDPAWTFWFGILSFLAAVIAITISIWIFYKQKQNKLLTYQIEADVKLVSVKHDHGEDIKILLCNQEVQDVRLVIIKIMNSGNTPITISDYDAIDDPSLQFYFHPNQVIHYGVQGTSNSTSIPRDKIQDKLTLASDKQTLALPPTPLNPEEWIRIKVLANGKVQVKVKGHLCGGKIKEFVAPKPHLSWGGAIGIGLTCLIIGILISNSIGIMSALVRQRCTFGSATIGGSSAFYTTVNEEAQNYHASCPVASLSVNESTSTSGLQDVENDQIQIADSELPVRSPNLTNLVDHPVAVIVFALIINNQITGITNLSTEQIHKIYDGTSKYWDNIQNGAPHLPITAYDRLPTSGTQNAFMRFVLNEDNDRLSPSVVPVDRTDQVVELVGQIPGAIGFVDVGTAYAASTTVTTISIDQHAPSATLVKNSLYRFWAIEHMYTKKNPDSLSSSFITYVIDSIHTNETFIRLEEISPTLLATHT